MNHHRSARKNAHFQVPHLCDLIYAHLWIAKLLGKEHARYVSRLIKQGKDDDTIQQQCKQLGEILKMQIDSVLTPETITKFHLI